MVNEITINTFKDLDKKWSSYNNCRVKNISVFLYKERVRDSHIPTFCEKLFQLPHCEKITIDFGGLSQLTDLGLTIFFENLTKYSDELEGLWISISTVNPSKKISIGSFRTATNILKKMTKLKNIEIIFEK